MSHIEINLTIKTDDNTLNSVCRVPEASLPALLTFIEENYRGDDIQQKLNIFWKTIIESQLNDINETNKYKAANLVEQITVIEEDIAGLESTIVTE